MPTTLRDLGERYILRHIIPEYCDAAGDDCAILNCGDIDVVISTDPVPVPAAQVIGGDSDLYWMGWLLVVINASDLAAAGAFPVGFVSALELEPERSVEDLRRLLDGIREACKHEGLKYVGGNLKEGSKLSGVGTAVGRSVRGRALGRRGARTGDLLVSVGAGGVFWRDALATMQGGRVKDKAKSPLFAPGSQVHVMHDLGGRGLVHASIDNSDGLLPSLVQLASCNSMSITVDLSSLSVSGSAELGIDPARLWLGWGDWNVFAAMPESDCQLARLVGAQLGVEITSIGEFWGTEAGVFLRRGDRTVPAPRLESERFAADSWFAEGIQAYVERLLAIKIPE